MEEFKEVFRSCWDESPGRVLTNGIFITSVGIIFWMILTIS